MQQGFNAPAPNAPPMWSANVFYPLNALVWYAGSVWRCESPHTSGSAAREPTQSLSLWTPVSSVTFGPGGGYAPAIDKSKRPAAQLTPQDQARAAAANEDQAASHNPAALRDELSGAHFWRVGGVGVFAYSEDSQVESQRRSVWSEFSKAHGREAWLHTARIRTDVYNSGQMQVRPLIRWHLVEGNAPLPNDVLLAGQEADGKNLYAARVWHGNGLHLGKAGDHLYGRCEYSWGGRTWNGDDNNPQFEVLCGSPDAIQWVPFEAGMAANQPGWQPVEGGREPDGDPMLVGRATHNGSVQPGKIHVNSMDVLVAYGGRETYVRPYQVLAYSSYQRR